jgi:uncharacterized protein (DUF1697 family)
MPERLVALLRGINVGGKNKLPMRDLREIFAAAGCRDVQTYIQSGNVLFGADAATIASLPSTVSAAIGARFGYQVPVVIRTAREMEAIIRHNPFVARGVAEDELHVLFLSEEPSASRIESLDPDRSPPDAFIVRGREVYLRLPNGAGRTKLTATYFDTKLETVGTQRNWRTVVTLRDRLAE